MDKILERDYQPKIRVRLGKSYNVYGTPNYDSSKPETILMKTDPTSMRGIPDLLLLFPSGRYAFLETKRDKKASRRALQDWWNEKINTKQNSFCRFICPENEEEVFHDLQQTFKP